MATDHRNGGVVFESANENNYASVEVVRLSQSGHGPAIWTVVMHGPPRLKNFKAGMALTYNSRSSNAYGSNNWLTVTNVLGPAKYLCTGNWPIRVDRS